MKTKLTLTLGFVFLCLSAAIGLAYTPSVAADVIAQVVCVQAATVNINSGITALNVRKVPITGEVITTLSTQTGLRVLAVDPDTCWYKISTTKGEGWITNSATYVTVARTPTQAATRTPIFTPTRILHQNIYCLKDTIEMTPVANLIRVECQIP